MKGAYPRNHLQHATVNYQQEIPHDVAIATPTLEVGVDMNNVTEVITHKAIRNISSYRQKVGRSGRERGTDALAVTLLSAGGQDFHHYRSMRRLVDADISDPVPVASGNKFVLCSQAYEAVFDFIVANTELEDIEFVGARRLDTLESRQLDANIQKARMAIYQNQESTQDCYNYVRGVIPILEAVDIHRSIRTADFHLKCMLNQIRQDEAGGSISIIRFISACNSGNRPPEIDSNRDTWNQIIRGREILIQFMNDEQITTFDAVVENRSVEGIRSLAQEVEILQPPVNRLDDAPEQSPILREVEDLCGQNRNDFIKTTYYLSTILRALPSIRYSAPFISPETLFLNPHEDEVEVRWPFRESGKSDFISNSEALIFTLPGMWTHRVFKVRGPHFLRHGRNLNQHRPMTFRMQMDSQVEQNKPQNIRARES